MKYTPLFALRMGYYKLLLVSYLIKHKQERDKVKILGI